MPEIASRPTLVSRHPLAGRPAAIALLALAVALPAAADEPQERRAAKDPVVRTFVLAEVDPSAAATLLRSVLPLPRVAVDDSRRTLIVRDDAETIRIVERLIEIADRPPGEAEVAVEVLEVDAAALAAWLAGEGRAAAGDGSAHRLGPGELAAFERRTAAVALARPRLSLIGERKALFRTTGLPATAAAGTAAPYRDFQIELSGRIHPRADGPGEVSLRFEIGTRRPAFGEAAHVPTAGDVTSSARLASGETFLVTALAAAGPAAAGSSGSRNASSDRVLVVALTPRVLRSPEPVPAGLEELRIAAR